MSSKLSKTNKKQVNKMSREDAVFYRMSSFFFILCAVVLFIVRIMDTASLRISTGRNMAYTLYNLFRNPIYIGVVAVLLVATLAWMTITKVKKIDEGRRIFTSTNAFALMLYLAGFSFYYGSSGGRTTAADSIFALTVTIILGLIYFISKIYHKDFLVFSAQNAVFALLIYRYFDISGTKGLIGKILLVVAALILGIVFARKLSGKPSKIKSGKSYTYFTIPYFVSLVLWGVCMFLNFVNPVSRGILLTALLIQYVIFAIVYTIKLIRE